MTVQLPHCLSLSHSLARTLSLSVFIDSMWHQFAAAPHCSSAVFAQHVVAQPKLLRQID